jgi:hypothetical protein
MRFGGKILRYEFQENLIHGNKHADNQSEALL